MENLVQLVSKSSYWKMLLRGDTWREAAMSLRRVHKDKRARKHVFGLLLLLLAPVILITYLLWIIGSGGILLVPFVIPVLWWRARRAKQDEVLMHITPQEESKVRELSREEQERLLAHLKKLALFYAAMVSRAATEGFLKEKTLPEGFEVIARRRHIDMLREHGLWEEMEAKDRDAVMMPDGHWDWSMINDVVVSLETVRLLRWALRIDYFLPVVGYQLRSEWNLAEELLTEAQWLKRSDKLIDLDSVRTAREAASTYFIRCWAEGVSRGYYQADDEESREWARTVSENLAGKNSEDLVLGATLVGEVGEQELRWATMVAARRKLFLEWMLRAMDGIGISAWEMSAFSAVQEHQPEATSPH